MEVGTAVHARDLELPEGSILQTDPEALVFHVVEPASEIAADAEEGGTAGDAAPAPVAPAAAE
jgi:large subunit ribosomal protein L25